MSERNAMLASAFPSVSRLDVVNRDRGGQDVKEEDDSQLSKRHCRAADREAGLDGETDLTQVQQRIIASGTLTVDEMNTFFFKKK